MASAAVTRDARLPITTAISASCSMRPAQSGKQIASSGPITVVAGLRNTSGSSGSFFFISAAWSL